jgi:hypothetical protein
MSMRVVVERSAVAEKYRGGVEQFAADAPHAPHAEGEVLSVQFDAVEEAQRWLDHLSAHGIAATSERAPFQRFDVLSTSASGLSYVRERKLGVTRVLTQSELEDFRDPAPCEECGEQFGCEHFNCAGEPLLRDEEIEREVPPELVSFAKDYGVSRGDLDRLRVIERTDGEYRLAEGAHTDMRMLELVLLLNEAR